MKNYYMVLKRYTIYDKNVEKFDVQKSNPVL